MRAQAQGGGPSFVYHMPDCRQLLLDAWIAGADRERALGPMVHHTHSVPAATVGRSLQPASWLADTKIRACVPVTAM